MKFLITITCLSILATTGYLATKEYRANEKAEIEDRDTRLKEVIGSLKQTFKGADR